MGMYWLSAEEFMKVTGQGHKSLNSEVNLLIEQLEYRQFSVIKNLIIVEVKICKFV